MSAFILKIIALISMACDHTSYLIYGKFSFLNYIGRLAFPIFAFQISEGYIHTKNLKKYILRLFIFALISEVPFLLFKSLFSSTFGLNVFFTLLIGLLAITFYDELNKIKCKNKHMHYIFNFLGLIFVAVMAYIAEVTECDYGYYGVLAIFVFYIFKNHKFLMNMGFILCTVIFYLKNLIIYRSLFSTYLLIIVFTCLSLVFIDLYNGRKGRNIKYFLYFFYPIHLLILYALSFIVHS